MTEWIQIGETDFLAAHQVGGWNYETERGLTFYFADRPSISCNEDKYIRLFFEQYADTHPGIAEIWKLWETQNI